MTSSACVSANVCEHCPRQYMKKNCFCCFHCLRSEKFSSVLEFGLERITYYYYCYCNFIYIVPILYIDSLHIICLAWPIRCLGLFMFIIFSLCFVPFFLSSISGCFRLAWMYAENWLNVMQATTVQYVCGWIYATMFNTLKQWTIMNILAYFCWLYISVFVTKSTSAAWIWYTYLWERNERQQFKEKQVITNMRDVAGRVQTLIHTSVSVSACLCVRVFKSTQLWRFSVSVGGVTENENITAQRRTQRNI